MLARAVHAERDGGDAQLAVESPVADTVFAEQVTRVPQVASGVLKPQDLRPVLVGTRDRFTVVRQASSVAMGYLASRLATLCCSLTRALSPSHW